MSELESLVNKGLAALVTMQEHHDLDGGALRFKLAPGLFVTRAKELAECDDAKLDDLGARLDRPGFESVLSALRRLTHETRSHGVGQPIRVLRRFFDVNADAALAQHGFTRFQVAALAARRCASQYPGDFGPITDEKQHEQGKQDRMRRLNAAYAAITEAIELDDLTEDVKDIPVSQIQFGITRLRLKIAPLVFYSPAATVGERLVLHFWQQGRRAEAA